MTDVVLLGTPAKEHAQAAPRREKSKHERRLASDELQQAARNTLRNVLKGPDPSFAKERATPMAAERRPTPGEPLASSAATTPWPAPAALEGEREGETRASTGGWKYWYHLRTSTIQNPRSRGAVPIEHSTSTTPVQYLCSTSAMQAHSKYNTGHLPVQDLYNTRARSMQYQYNTSAIAVGGAQYRTWTLPLQQQHSNNKSMAPIQTGLTPI